MAGCASGDSSKSLAGETTPLLPQNGEVKKKPAQRKGVVYLALLTGFLVSLSFGVTQVPMLYVFRVMTCDEYYKHNPIPDPDIDRCSKRPILASTARAVSLLGASTTVFGIANLIITGWSIKRFGVKLALLIQIFWPAVRLAVQNIGVAAGGQAGIIIIQASQVLTVIGGPNGYVLTLNSFITDVSTHEQRTGALGRLQGVMLYGAAIGFLCGGLLGDAFGIAAPFQITLLLFVLCFIYVALVLPSIPPEQDIAAREEKVGVMKFFGPLKIFEPQTWVLQDGRKTTQYGALTLGIGVFLGILATGYIQTSLQMYSTDRFNFGTRENGWLISLYFTLRGSFLTFVFPRIITTGRKFYKPTKKYDNQVPVESVRPDMAVTEPLLGIQPNEIGPIDPMDNDNTEPPAQFVHQSPGTQKLETYAFDLLYARFSLVMDGILTGLAVFVSQGYQLYIVASIIPLAAGTGSASKGALLQMIPENERVDALSGMSLVENVARLSTTGIFGLIFAALASVGKTHLVFACNAGVALIGFIVLCFSRFPPEGSTRLIEEDKSQESATE
ncbi:hypothetical protein BU24DRAFT_345018 [Aaosphaeria arxii CBS 175.79]|uniref:MFS general substrate transporter n=1 Tax=Aaosphaeria arxii CBS 175.79 TaxID=1450172 RepID=A0A6A5XWV5_9PLEO|nr:uncharacterized protein BU24DRAFT_345018 [Aaosphaeria arxii CBS 175.79]KAF2017825.1 hypothetical protein BU24DRAFT_345018 [Aaosphaeria arxii CBS 175.79]